MINSVRTIVAFVCEEILHNYTKVDYPLHYTYGYNITNYIHYHLPENFSTCPSMKYIVYVEGVEMPMSELDQIEFSLSDLAIYTYNHKTIAHIGWHVSLFNSAFIFFVNSPIPHFLGLSSLVQSSLRSCSQYD